MKKLHIPLKGHRWHGNSDESLRYIMKDADGARQAMGGQADLKYEDQINDASTILGWRRRNPGWQKLMSARGRVREFSSPISEFRKSARESEAEFLERLRRVSMQEKVRMDSAMQKLHNESYAYPAAGIGAGVGLGAGALAARRGGLPLAIGAGLAGSLIGSLGGQEIGGRIRRNQNKNLSANLKPVLRELAARSGRIVEFGDAGADASVLGALKAVASADESPAQRAMLLKRGLIEMVRGKVVITERGYGMMQKAGMPPNLTPEERREEIISK